MKLEKYLNRSVSPFHATQTVISRLQKEGFEEYRLGENERLDSEKELNDKKDLDGKKSSDGKNGLDSVKGYYISPYPSTVFAFKVNQKNKGMRIALAHTDSPSFLVKPNPGMKGEDYCRINVEPYGGMLKRTWFDRPLGLAGRVMLKNKDDVFSPEPVLFDSKEPWFVIPSLAPHLDREIESKKLDVQKEMMPIYALGDSEISIFERIAKCLEIDEDDILSYELYLYNTDKSEYVGVDKDMILAPRIDNIASVAALCEGIIARENIDSFISMAACFDNEEIGSRTKQGADSGLLKTVIEDIYRRFGRENDLAAEYEKSMMLSVDGAQGMHPNYSEKSDVTASVLLNKGVVLKTSASQRYVTDAKATAVVKGLCEKNGIRLQMQANRSGAPGGQTLGPIASSYLPILAADLGIPMLAMHSARELAAISDYEELCKLVREFLR